MLLKFTNCQQNTNDNNITNVYLVLGFFIGISSFLIFDKLQQIIKRYKKCNH